MKTNIRYGSVILLLVLWANCSNATTFVVATDGDDGGDGAANLPFQTISHAIAKAGAGDVIEIEPGIYRESLIFNSSGKENSPITVKAQKPGTVIIEGADPLTGWKREPEGKPIYSTTWNHDFFFSEGVRTHLGPKTDGATTAVGYAEQFIAVGAQGKEQVLRQVIHPHELEESTFSIDYDAHRVSIWLPGGVDPAKITLLASTRSILASPAGNGGSNISLQGLVFRHAANFAQRWALRTGDGWRMEDCLAEWCNAGGVGVMGKNVRLTRVTSQDNGQLGLGGSKNVDAVLQDCISQRNNYKGFSPGNEAGGGKFTATEGLKILNCSYRDNNGIGLWLDFKNKNYFINGGSYTGNHYTQPKYIGVGIMIEISDGPGRIENAWFSGNSGAGLEIGESMKLTVQGNTFIHNYIDMRAMDRPPYDVSDVTISGNRFKDAAIGTSVGSWPVTALADKRIVLNGNTYDNSADQPIIYWGDVRAIHSLNEAREKLGVETNGRVGTVDPAEPRKVR